MPITSPIIQRRIQPTVLELAGSFPVVTVTGPRQSGKTPLCRTAFPELRYVSLENPDEQRSAGLVLPWREVQSYNWGGEDPS